MKDTEKRVRRKVREEGRVREENCIIQSEREGGEGEERELKRH